MFDIKGVLFLCLSLVILQAYGRVVSFIEPCYYDDPVCMLKSAKKALPYVSAGIPEIGVPSFDPLVLNDVNGDNGDLKLQFKLIKVHGLPKCEIANVHRPNKLKLETELICPFSATGKYTLGGKLFVLEVEGNGDFLIKSDKIKFLVSSNLKVVKKDGIDYYRISKFDFKYDALEKVYFTFENLYNGDKAKAEPVISILDQSWKEITNELGKNIFKEIITQVVNGIARLISHVPCKELELEKN